MPLLSPPSTISETSKVLDDSFSEIPEYRISEETLRYIGFNNETAASIWNEWNNCKEEYRETHEGMVTFESVFRGHIHGQPRNAWTDDDEDWEATMTIWGLQAELQAAIMAAPYREVRLTQSCKEWVLDTLSAKYRCLETIHAASKERIREARRAASRSNGTSGHLTPSGAASSHPEGAKNHMEGAKDHMEEAKNHTEGARDQALVQHCLRAPHRSHQILQGSSSSTKEDGSGGLGASLKEEWPGTWCHS